VTYDAIGILRTGGPKASLIHVPIGLECLPPPFAVRAHTVQFPPFAFPSTSPTDMPHESPRDEPTFGFLSSLESPDHGYFGGYLIVSPLGRPVEFHCTSPVRPSRAQEILYGPTLQPYLLGDQISSALLQAAKLTPRLIVTDQAAMLVARNRANAPMTLLLAAHLHGPSGAAPANDRDGIDPIASSFAASGLRVVDGRFTVGNYELQIPTGFESEMNAVSQSVSILSHHIELFEPFGRIHEAIREAQRIGGRTAEAHGQAA
jgi:hypothetical protein